MFNIGDKIVYPMHGAGVIEGIEEKEILGKKRKYYVMRLPLGDMKVMIPIDNTENIGLREVINEEQLAEVIEILKGSKSKMSQNWNRRYRANMDKIKSGDIYEIAEVVRNLVLLDEEKGLSTGERKMLNSAKQILISEFALIRNLSEQEAENMLQNILSQ
ncbi:CarD family transcriptional regulator [Garciella nitratireducens]|uniref:Transcriptional regulator, CarD family n=1 Tax=Garciella nitratireducens DSM 15102 TaxID=1121911 RepID=A0A1T4PM18_9FIRM|nr:CarD family transcriptional regulator [Garciella nitratireducens]RBP44848.1 CarD family transcriptional regulator [Garciella nitratireducens]SJZ92267.1 transcriptional regulator, CarD family [Garciella nitratireducens DSM 15102]